jgi:hypothetical protein
MGSPVVISVVVDDRRGLLLTPLVIDAEETGAARSSL